MLRSAVDESPWHRDRLAGADIDQITSDDLSSLPTMTKTDLMEDWDAIVTDPAVSLDDAQQVLDVHGAGERFRFLRDRFLVVATGGSTGVRSVLVGDEYWYGAPLGSDFAMGRAQEVLVHPHVFRSALLADPAILSYQIRQTAAGANISVIPVDAETTDSAGLARRVSDGLRRAGVTDPVVDVTTVADLEHHAQSGKLRRFVPLTKST